MRLGENGTRTRKGKRELYEIRGTEVGLARVRAILFNMVRYSFASYFTATANLHALPHSLKLAPPHSLACSRSTSRRALSRCR